MSQSIPGKPVSLHCLDFQDEDPLTPRWHVGQPFGKSLRESHRSLDPCEEKRDTAAKAREESALACPHSRRGLAPLGRLQKYPKVHVSPGEESSGPAPTPRKGLGPGIMGEESREAPEQLVWGLAFPEATRAGP